MEDDERRDAEERHRGHRLLGAQLDAQVLAQEGGRRGSSAIQRSQRAGVEVARGREQPGAPAAQAEHEVGLGQAARRVVGGEHARAPATRGRSAARRARRRPGRGATSGSSSSSSSGSCSTARQIARRWTMPRESVCTGSSARAVIRTASSSSSTRASAHAVQAGVEAQVLAPGEVAVEQRLVAEQADAPAHRPAPRRAARGRARAPRRRAGAAAWRARAAASTCRRRWGRTRRASARAAASSVTPASAGALAVVAAQVLDVDGGLLSRLRGHGPRDRRARPRGAASRPRARSVGASTGKSWSIAFGLPGKFTISVRPAIPDDPAREDAQRRVAQRLGAHGLGVARAPRARSPRAWPRASRRRA